MNRAHQASQQRDQAALREQRDTVDGILQDDMEYLNESLMASGECVVGGLFGDEFLDANGDSPPENVGVGDDGTGTGGKAIAFLKELDHMSVGEESLAGDGESFASPNDEMDTEEFFDCECGVGLP